jgi:hypothetical protein
MTGEHDATGQFFLALADLAEQHGFEAALTAAAMTLAHYSAAASVGLTRQRDLILIVPPNDSVAEKP